MSRTPTPIRNSIPTFRCSRRRWASPTAPMSRYLLRRQLLVVPGLVGISGVLWSVLALPRGGPSGELPTNPNVPPGVGAELGADFGLDDPVWLRYLHCLIAMLHGYWG